MSINAGLAALIIAAATMTGAMAQEDVSPAPIYEDLGECRITCYCPECNDGTGHESSSGAYLKTGHAACRWLPVGTIIDIEGDEFEIVDTCGTDAIDIFIDDDSGECRCNLNEYKRVTIKRERKDR